MALLGDATITRVELPHEPGEWVDVRPLTWRELEKARRQSSQDFMESVKGLDAGLIRELFNGADDAAADADDDDDEDDDAEAAKAKPEEISKAVALKSGIVRWSYDSKVTGEAIERLDDVTATLLYRAIRDLSVRTSAQGEVSGAR